jgi:hypothetical protein
MVVKKTARGKRRWGGPAGFLGVSSLAREFFLVEKEGRRTEEYAAVFRQGSINSKGIYDLRMHGSDENKL